MSQSALLGRIVHDPGICGGSATIRGTRVEVQEVLDSLAAGMAPEAIVENLPSLRVEDVQACLAYAAEVCREQVWKVATA